MSEDKTSISPGIMAPTTAAIHPDRYPEALGFIGSRYVVTIAIIVFMVVGFGLRVNQLGAESLSEDELNKLQTVDEYRQNGLSGRNGEHPFLMKGMQWLSVSAAERLNAVTGASISPEAALRFPIALLGTFSILLIYLLVTALFGRSVGLVSSALWAVEPIAISFDRIAKEDSVVLFFFLLANVFWIKSQTEAERGNDGWFRWSLLSGIAFAALMASKYYPWLLGTQAAYYFAFQQIPGQRWALGKPKWAMIFTVMAVAFLVFNPTILFPETWREMLKFSSENRIGHDSYEFMGTLYRNQMTLWLRGMPWTFYYVFLGVKSTIPVLVLFIVGLAIVFTRPMGDGRIFMFFWAALWFPAFTVLGGKFTRYFAIVEPFVLITAAVGFCFLIGWVSKRLSNPVAFGAQMATLCFLLGFLTYCSLSVAPHFRLFTNTLGGGMAQAGYYFPHDEFYDAATQQTVDRIVPIASPGATVASETPGLFQYYAARAGRPDLKFISLSQPDQVRTMDFGDFIVITRGRRYFSNDEIQIGLEQNGPSPDNVYLGEIPAARIYAVDPKGHEFITRN